MTTTLGSVGAGGAAGRSAGAAGSAGATSGISPAPPAAWRRALRSPNLIIGALITLTVAVVTILAPVIAPYDPNEMDFANTLAPPSAQYPLGTDQLGHGLLTVLLHGGRVDLSVALLAAATPFVVGVLLGTVAGYVGGPLDRVIARVTDTVVAFPFYVLVIAIVAMVGQGTVGIVVTFAIVGWIGYARVVRTATRAVATSDYVVAARGGGLGHARVLLRHVLPATITQAVVLLVSEIVLIMVAIVTLGFLGLGYDPSIPEWGAMIDAGRPFLTDKWWMSVAPGGAVVLVGVGLSLLADGLSELWGQR
jgi:peptide/nickel transport system permease protein